MVGDYKKRFLAQAQPLALHGGGGHLKGLARAHTMGQQGIPAVEHPGHCIALVGFQPDFRVHPHKGDVLSVIGAGPDRVKNAVVGRTQFGPPVRVFENPFPERLADGLLLLLGDGGFLWVQHPLFFSVLVGGVINPGVPQVQGIFKDDVGIAPLGAVGFPDAGVGGAVCIFVLYAPLAAGFGVKHPDTPCAGVPVLIRSLEQFKHELLVIFRGNPVRADAHVDLGGGQVFGLHLLQCGYIGVKLRVFLSSGTGCFQLTPHIAGQVFVGSLPASVPVRPAAFQVKGTGVRVFENHPL